MKLMLQRPTEARRGQHYKGKPDHLVLRAGRMHPRSIEKLMLQLRDGEDRARKKDRLERRLQQLVCSKFLGLRAAQAAIWTDWQAAYRRYVQAP